MLILRLLLITVLATLFVQDQRYRAISWPLLPLVFILGVAVRLTGREAPTVIWETTLASLLFLGTQLLLLTLYLSWRSGRLVKLTRGLLGWGDVLLLIVLCAFLPLLNYILFYTLSLLLIVTFWALRKTLFPEREARVPLAGLQALLLALLISTGLCLPTLDPSCDEWLITALNFYR